MVGCITYIPRFSHPILLFRSITISSFCPNSLRFPLINLFPLKYHEVVIKVLPLLLSAFFLNALTSVFASVIDGLNLIYFRNIIYALASILFLITSWLLLKRFNFVGLIYSQLIQSTVLLISCFMLVVLRLKGFSLTRFYFNKNTFKQIISDGLKFQLIGITLLFFDPVSKYCLMRFGGLSAVGFYEMANRLISQLRSVIVSANQVIVPLIAKEDLSSSNSIIRYYHKTIRVTGVLSLCLLIFVFIYSPLISLVWLGSTNFYFIFSLIVLSVGWCFNIFSVPAYYFYIGLGDLKWNVVSHLVLAVSNLSLGLLLGFFFNSYAVIVAISVSLIISSLLTIIPFHKKYKISFNATSFFKENVTYLILFLAFFICYFYLLTKVSIAFLSISISVLLCAILILLNRKFKIFPLILRKVM